MIVQPPLLAVVMPVFNAGKFLDQAVRSVLTQTFADFQFVIYDDCSTDGSYERVLDWAARDSRIQAVRGSRRLGPQASSSAAAALPEAIFVARMDADDVAAPSRFERQLKILQSNPQAVLVGSTFEMIDGAGRAVRTSTVRRIDGRAAPFAHASILYRNAAFRAAGGYRPDTDYFEDADLYRRLATQGELLVINRPLLKIRFAGQNTRLRDKPKEVLESINRLYASSLAAPPSSRLDPMSFYSLAVLSITSLRRPRLLAAMVRRMNFLSRPLLATIVMAVLILAEISPTFTRWLLALLSSLRNREAKPVLDPHEVYRWEPLTRSHGANDARSTRVSGLANTHKSSGLSDVAARAD